jgi:hypothetical protein
MFCVLSPGLPEAEKTLQNISNTADAVTWIFFLQLDDFFPRN